MAFDYTTIAFLMLCISVTVNLMFTFWTHIRVLKVESYLARQCVASVAISPEDIKHLDVNFASSNPNSHVVSQAHMTLSETLSEDSDLDDNQLETEHDDRLSLPESEDSDSDFNQLEMDDAAPSAIVGTPRASSVSEDKLETSNVETPEVVHAVVAEIDYKKMNVASLKDLCESRGISFSKKDRKEDLIGHLKHWDENQ
jgi:hypothetical protein